VSGCTADVETTLDVSKYLPEGVVVTKESAYINVKIAIEKSVTRNITVTTGDIILRGKQSGYSYEMSMGDSNTITVSGISSAVSKVSAKSLKLSIDASKLSYGDNTITLSVPDGDKYTVVNTCSYGKGY